ncbi:MAG: tRNA (adenosine(37)-N6)-dimethylallyltransferase MiaA [Candidatus Hydrogenedentota bacterium]|nr:MAG: tRNA (adenosine(37)-N6)-dimethylallyltransferase MiaA [Candidatus Hydrogenedentota bacterium]
MKKVVILTGPTAVGKSSLVYQLPQNTPIEIIGADSRQVYRDLQIGTAGPTEEELKLFPHHLVYHVDLTEKYSAGRFVKEANQKIQEIHDRGKIPLIVGGTFFYIKSLFVGIAEEPPENPALLQEIQRMENKIAREKLEKLDPISFRRIPAQDEFRIKRALYYCLAAKQPFSSAPRIGSIKDKYHIVAFAILRDRKDLYWRAEERISVMFQKGLIEETARAYEKVPTSPALSSIGYLEIVQYCQENQISASEMLKRKQEIQQNTEQLIARNTRRFIKRQLTWIRATKELKKIDYACAFSHLSDSLIQKEAI